MSPNVFKRLMEWRCLIPAVRLINKKEGGKAFNLYVNATWASYHRRTCMGREIINSGLMPQLPPFTAHPAAESEREQESERERCILQSKGWAEETVAGWSSDNQTLDFDYYIGYNNIYCSCVLNKTFERVRNPFHLSWLFAFHENYPASNQNSFQHPRFLSGSL